MENEVKMSPKEARAKLAETGNRLVDESIGSFLSLRHVEKVYPNGIKAVTDFNLEANKGEFVALLGPSGCGKSTTLRMIAGLEEISSGELYINKTYSNYLPSKERDIAMVFQTYALYPQMSVYDNIGFGLKMRHMKKEEIEERVHKAAEILDLGHLLDRRPKELSGGQMQRVALGRALVRQAGLFLMDEPLSNLDAKLRVQMRSEIIKIHKAAGATTVYVTHDQTEAMTMADKVVVMNRGYVQQIGSPMYVYEHPANLFVASFIGSPSMNILDGVLKGERVILEGGFSFPIGVKRAANYRALLESFRKKLEDLLKDPEGNEKAIVDLAGSLKPSQKQEKKAQSFLSKFFKKKGEEEKEPTPYEALSALHEEYASLKEGELPIKVGIRPEDFYLEDDFRGFKASPVFRGSPDLVELLGHEFIVHLPSFGTMIELRITSHEVPVFGKSLGICFDLSKIHLFDPYSGISLMDKEKENL